MEAEVPQFIIRPARADKADLAAARALLEETFVFRAQVAAAEPSLTFRRDTQASYLEECLLFVRQSTTGHSPDQLALLACLLETPKLHLKPIEKPVGLLLARIQHDYYYSPEYYGYIEQLIVTDTARSLGVGAKLLDAACEWLRSRQVHTATLKVYGPNLDALHFYQHEGFHSLRHELVKHF